MRISRTTVLLSLIVSLAAVIAIPTAAQVEIPSDVLQRQTPLLDDVLGRRQTDSELCTDPVALERRLASERCSPSLIAELQEIIGRGCGFFGLFGTIEDQLRQCGRDENGTVCAFHNPSTGQDTQGIRSIDAVTEEVNRRCLEAQSVSETLENCSSDCRRALEEFSSLFGCCIHAGGLTTGDHDDSRRIFTQLLWSRCGVTRPDPCPDIPTLPKSQTGITCSFQCALTQASALECKHIGSIHLQILEECGARDNSTSLEIQQRCGFNVRGDYCGQIAFNIPRDYAFTVYNKCYRFYTSSECTEGCKAALEEMVDMYGCCLNVMNTTVIDENDIEHLVTGYDLWSTCDVETPGFCSFPADLSVYDDLRNCNTCTQN